MKEKHSLKEVILNLIYSFASYAMPTAVLQFIVQPIIAKLLGSDLNGQYLTLMSFNYFMIGVTASVLNTVRMLQQKKYDEQSVKGDFNIIYVIYTCILLVVMPIGYLGYVGTADFCEIVLYLIIGNLYLYHDYIFCQYRLNLQYNKILVNNILQVLGYGIGLLIFLKTKKWQFVYISAYSISFVYDFFNTDYIREPVRRTHIFLDTVKILLIYTCSMLFSSSITYCDKLILYPILGGESVSIYNTASLVGKMLVLISAPLNSVLLSYIVKIDSLDFKIPKKYIVFFACGILVAYGGCVGIGYPLTRFLYPDWATKSQAYIPITVAASLINLLGNLFNTVLLRFCNIKFQIIIQAINFVIYISIGLLLLNIASLMGFCVGILIAAIIKLIMMVFIFKKKRLNNNKGELEV